MPDPEPPTPVIHISSANAEPDQYPESSLPENDAHTHQQAPPSSPQSGYSRGQGSASPDGRSNESPLPPHSPSISHEGGDLGRQSASPANSQTQFLRLPYPGTTASRQASERSSAFSSSDSLIFGDDDSRKWSSSNPSGSQVNLMRYSRGYNPLHSQYHITPGMTVANASVLTGAAMYETLKSTLDLSRPVSSAGSTASDDESNAQMTGNKYGVALGDENLLVGPEEVEADDYLHNPDPNDKDTPDCNVCNRRGFWNILGLLLVTGGILALFVAWPILYVENCPP